MVSGFKRTEVDQLLVRCRRRCCICNRFCGTKIETDHILPREQGGDDSIDNAITVCFDCHAEIHMYNPKHPRGRRYTENELKMHKEQWLHICEEKPEIFLKASNDVDIGPMQGLLDELEHNLVISENLTIEKLGFKFKDEQLSRAIRMGVLSTIDDGLKRTISLAYGAISKANESVISYNEHGPGGGAFSRAVDAVKQAIPLIQEAQRQLLKFVRSDSSEG